jgi:LysR family transcriptional activator of mexEF-oprN operon
MVAHTPAFVKFTVRTADISAVNNGRMTLERLDLNLLRVFQAIDAERNVTRAAARLGVTQSAASNALARLRAAFRDDLFQRTPAGMAPTALARELAGPVAAALDAVRSAVELNRPFDPATARDEFVVGVSDYAEFVLVPPLVEMLRDRAPGVSAVFSHADRGGALTLLDQDRVHLAVGIFPEPPTRMTRIVLLRDEFVVLLRADHPAAAALDLDAYLAAPHLLVSPAASREGAVDRALAALGRSRELAAVVSHHLVVGPILLRSSLICTLAERLAGPIAAAFGLALRPLPRGLDLPAQPTSLVFHNRYAQRPSHRWLRTLVTEVARSRSVEAVGVPSRRAKSPLT